MCRLDHVLKQEPSTWLMAPVTYMKALISFLCLRATPEIDLSIMNILAGIPGDRISQPQDHLQMILLMGSIQQAS
jgi:hypothetical protein